MKETGTPLHIVRTGRHFLPPGSVLRGDARPQPRALVVRSHGDAGGVLEVKRAWWKLHVALLCGAWAALAVLFAASLFGWTP